MQAGNLLLCLPGCECLLKMRNFDETAKPAGSTGSVAKTAGGLFICQANLLKIGSDLMLISLPSAQFAFNAVVMGSFLF